MVELRALHAHVDQLRLGAFQLRGRLCHVGFRDDAGIVLIGHERERALVARDGCLEQALLRVGDAQLEIILGERGLHGQAQRGEIGGASLDVGLARFHGAADLAPDVDFPARAQARAELIGRAGGTTRRAACRCAARTAATLARPARRAARGNDRKVAGAGRIGQRLRIPVLRVRRAHVLVRYFDLLFQPAQLRVAENLPPLAAIRIVRGLRDFPLARLLVCGGNVHRRAGVVGADGARGDQDGQNESLQ